MCVLCVLIDKEKIRPSEAFRIIEKGELQVDEEHEDELLDKILEYSLSNKVADCGDATCPVCREINRNKSIVS